MEPVGVVKRCGVEYGMTPRGCFAENRHAALGRRPFVAHAKSSKTTPPEVRLLLNHPSLFHRNSTHLRWLAHARSRSRRLPVLRLPRCWHWSGGNSGRCWPSHAAAQVAARKGHSRVRHFGGVFTFRWSAAARAAIFQGATAAVQCCVLLVCQCAAAMAVRLALAEAYL